MDSINNKIKQKLKDFKTHYEKSQTNNDTKEGFNEPQDNQDLNVKSNIADGTNSVFGQGGFTDESLKPIGTLNQTMNIDKYKGKLDYAFDENLAGGTNNTFEKINYTKQQFNKLGDKLRTDEYKGKLDFAFDENLAGGTKKTFETGGYIDSTVVQPAVGSLKTGIEETGKFFTSGGGFNAYHADEVPRYIPPYIRRRIDSQKKKEVNIAKVMAGTGPISMFIIQVLDFMVDLAINIITILTELFTDGFDFAYSGLLGEYQGIFPENNTYGTYFSFRFFRTFITIITPPVGVFMAKGVKGWMNILICLMFCYIHYAIGILYAFVITFRNKYADRYEKIQETKMEQNKAAQAAAGQGNITDYAYIIGGFLFIGAIFGTLFFILGKI